MPANKLYYGDNLDILRDRAYFPDACVDLIYLDPPFNSSRSYNVLFKDESGRQSDAQITAFEDTWHWGRTAGDTLEDLLTQAPPRVGTAMGALREIIGANQMMAYLVMMTARLVELHRVLKPTGSLYLHCDPTASHYLKIILDTIFGAENFLNEIVWKRSHAHNSGLKFGPIHDVLLYYVKSNTYTWNPQHRQFDDSYIESHYKYVEDGRRYKRQDLTGSGIRNGETGKEWRGIDPTPKGRHWMRPPSELEKMDAQGLIYWPDKPGAWPYLKLFLDERLGMLLQDVWEDIDPVNPVAKERLGYPTQKPLALLERIISASSNPGDLVLDPFCGCGTAVAAAQKLGRAWIGIDITHLSVALMKYRLRDMFDLKPKTDYTVIGEPEDLAGAGQLAQDDRYQFQWWALSLVEAQPLGGEAGGKRGKKGADRGIDGVIPFMERIKGQAQRQVALVQVKSGHVQRTDIADLARAVEREKAALGVFITLEESTKPMRDEALSMGYYTSPGWNQRYPRIQILTVDDLLRGARIEMPPAYGTFRQAGRVQAGDQPEQFELFGDE